MSKTDKYQLWPFIKLENGDWSIPDKLLQGIWESIVAQGKNDIVFYDVAINTWEDWERFIKTPSNHFVFVVDSEAKEFCFGAWLNNLHGHIAHGHFVGIAPYRQAMGRTVLDYWANMGMPLLILGIMPVWNKLAIRMAMSLGFKKSGIIPRYCYRGKTKDYSDGIITYYDTVR